MIGAVDSARIECARFTLVPFTLPFIDALLRRDATAAQDALAVRLDDIDWIDADERFLRVRRDDLVRDPASLPWLARAIVCRDFTMAGHIGFHGPPDAEGMVELGYTVFTPYRRRGYAAGAIACMISWAGERDVRRLRLSIAPGNAPSLALAAKLGFMRAGEQIDPIDGLELVFERDAT